MDLTGLSKEEMKEIKVSLNEIMARRQVYKLQETKEKLLRDNDRYIEMDIKLIKKIIKIMEEE
jgi:hypothetical protein